MSLKEIYHREIAYIDQLLEEKLDFQDYLARYSQLSRQERAIAGYLLASTGSSRGHGYFSYFASDREVVYPFRFCGWAGLHKDLGPMFQINRDCFPLSLLPRLFYTDDDMPFRTQTGTEPPEYLIELSREIERNSSGLANVKPVLLPEQDGKPAVWGISFLLSESAVRKSVAMDGMIPTAPLGGYLFALPKAGEFDCCMGELYDDSYIVLHHDSFCMK